MDWGDYANEFEKLFERPRSEIRRLVLNQMVNIATPFRSVYWRVLLGCLPENRADWTQALQYYRQDYTNRIRNFELDPRQFTEDDPLSQDGGSSWNQFFQNEELRATIWRDVERTWPEVDVFQLSEVRRTMTTVLFLYSRSKPDISYRQGMHEILAPIVYVLYCDSISYEKALSVSGGLTVLSSVSRSILAEVFDPSFHQHDAFAMFSVLMKTLESWYSCALILPESESSKTVEPSESVLTDQPSKDAISSSKSAKKYLRPTFSNSNLPQPFSNKQRGLAPRTILGQKLENIGLRLLKQLDPHLQMRLMEADATFQIFGVRWLRLLFSREFPLFKVLLLWDAIFAESVSLKLADYVFLSMLIVIRNDLLSTCGDVDCLDLLIRYPADRVDISFLIRLALHFQNPSHFSRPLETRSPVADDGIPVGSCDSLAKSSQCSYRASSRTLPQFLNERFRNLPIAHSQIRVNRPQSLNLGVESPDFKPNRLPSEISHDRQAQIEFFQNSHCCAVGDSESNESRQLYHPGSSRGYVLERELGPTTSGRQLLDLRNQVADCARLMDIHLLTIQKALVFASAALKDGEVCSGGLEPLAEPNHIEKSPSTDDALLALAQLKTVRDRLKKVSNVDDQESEECESVHCDPYCNINGEPVLPTARQRGAQPEKVEDVDGTWTLLTPPLATQTSVFTGSKPT